MGFQIVGYLHKIKKKIDNSNFTSITSELFLLFFFFDKIFKKIYYALKTNQIFFLIIYLFWTSEIKFEIIHGLLTGEKNMSDFLMSASQQLLKRLINDCKKLFSIT